MNYPARFEEHFQRVVQLEGGFILHNALSNNVPIGFQTRLLDKGKILIDSQTEGFAKKLFQKTYFGRVIEVDVRNKMVYESKEEGNAKGNGDEHVLWYNGYWGFRLKGVWYK